ncbi:MULTISPECIES: ABC transporter permease [unclassified Streptomyces]|uniref:ABC transporter permease n=1 Tax=unclassified Streptomyces TaxID=2593676 RepID=UPI00166021DE|nr:MULTISPECIES: ABC transporter permease [unclassified Streptomyces]MBD0708612.1 ABC transporter [Streptomyces sp. CBMA291]MBD0713125.1 ABC transporter [Streptomyces sp. CBMA370]
MRLRRSTEPHRTEGPGRLARFRRRGTLGIEPSRLAWRDLVSESTAGLLQRPARAALTALGTVLGVGSFVAVLGLTATAASQIDGRFTELNATEVTVQDVSGEYDEFETLAFPGDADRRVERLNGVTHGGVLWSVQPGGDRQVRAAPVAGVSAASQIQIVAASSGALLAAEPALREGRVYDRWHDTTRQRVAVIGAGMAARLGITTLETQPALFIGDEAFTVIGVVEDVRRKADLLLSVIVPRSTAQELWGPPKDGAEMLVSTRVGAAQQVAREAPVALRPDHPEYLRAVPPPDPRALRSGVSGDLGQLFLVLAAVCLFIGSVGIANTTLVAVMERTGEIGLRRALGARGRHVLAQFLTESGVLGALGGLVGTSLGVSVVVAVAMAREWTPVIQPTTVVAAPVIGLLTGLLAGLYPAWRASRIQPVEALRR